MFQITKILHSFISKFKRLPFRNSAILICHQGEVTKELRPGYEESRTDNFQTIWVFQSAKKMPVENLEEEGLPKNPNLELAAWRFTLNNPEGKDKEDVKKKLLEAIKENGM